VPDDAAADKSFDYSQMGPVGGESVSRILSEHTTRSVALSALLLWEDHLYEQHLGEEGALLTPGLGPAAPELLPRTEWQVCTACTAYPNGCSPNWIVPQSCAGTSIVGPCDNHDACYQCGAVCSGTTRAQCDAQLRSAIQAVTGSSFCATAYWVGVRLLGWMFYQNPYLRPAFGPDVYYVGIELTACEGQYAHMCTIYVM
jgi:hypothetical protein